MKALVIPTSFVDKPFVIDVPKGKELQTYYSTIGCRLIDIVELHYDEASNKTIDCIVDDEGLLNGSEINLYWAKAYVLGLINSPLYGTTIITMSNLTTGNSIGISLSQVKNVLIENYGFTEDDFENC